MTNVQKFIKLQDKANKDIDTYGITTDETATELEKVGDLLNHLEIEQVIEHYDNIRK